MFYFYHTPGGIVQRLSLAVLSLAAFLGLPFPERMSYDFFGKSRRWSSPETASLGLITPPKTFFRRSFFMCAMRENPRDPAPGVEPGGHEQSSIVPEGLKSTAELAEAPPSESEVVPP